MKKISKMWLILKCEKLTLKSTKKGTKSRNYPRFSSMKSRKYANFHPKSGRLGVQLEDVPFPNNN